MNKNETTPTSLPCTKLLSVPQVAEVLNISISSAYQLSQTGEIPSVRIGRSVRVRPEDLQSFIQANLY